MKQNDRVVYFGKEDDTEVPAEFFGNKTAKLTGLSGTGLAVPPGFTFGISLCREYYENDRHLPDWYYSHVSQGISYLEDMTGKETGSRKNPLILSVRSGAAASMPGIMETVLNAGINRETIEGVIFSSGNPRFAWDLYRRFLESFGCTVLGHSGSVYKKIISEYLSEEKITEEKYLCYDTLRSISEEFEKLYPENILNEVISDPKKTIEYSVKAVLDSWTDKKAEDFKRLNPQIKYSGTAVTIQTMVFGNINRRSGSGVAFTKNPWTGEDISVIDFQYGCQGGEIVSGYFNGIKKEEIDRKIPGLSERIISAGRVLEKRYRDMQDFEFTVENEKLYILQTRDGKRADIAGLKIASSLVSEGTISEDEGIKLTENIRTDRIYTEKINSDEIPAGYGSSASLGAVSGRIAFSEKKAEILGKNDTVILVKEFLSPDDINAISLCSGLLAKRGAVTSHAAVVAREMGKVCIVNCRQLEIIPQRKICTIGRSEFKEGDHLTLDGATGGIYAGIQEIVREKPEELTEIINSRKKNSGRKKGP